MKHFLLATAFLAFMALASCGARKTSKTSTEITEKDSTFVSESFKTSLKQVTKIDTTVIDSGYVSSASILLEGIINGDTLKTEGERHYLKTYYDKGSNRVRSEVVIKNKPIKIYLYKSSEFYAGSDKQTKKSVEKKKIINEKITERKSYFYYLYPLALIIVYLTLFFYLFRRRTPLKNKDQNDKIN